ncbi:thiamine pyrophosphate-binding protein [Micromonospora sp. Llam7]|uniref:thiamine pyrophosphate-dependent enzyme n=1 Tax=Micromonospora tarapacensis TaxID=2835305 RepID=UPI001C829266|nr:thiamine pyrophosphate-binding protein [Micromonospora tarapacensis]
MDRAAGPPRTAAGTVVATLLAHGVDRVFCVAGESYLAVLDELHATPAVDVVTSRHEASAGFAAVADAKLTGRAGVCLVSRGPGATNASIAVHSALQDAVPLVLVVGQVPRVDLGTEAFQEVDYARAFSALAKEVLVLLEPARAGEFVARALRTAESGTPGPVVLVLPEDVLEMPDPDGAVPARWQPAATGAAPAELDRVRELLRRSERPLLLAGGALSGQTGRRLLAAAAHRHHLPVLTSNKRQDLFDNRDPCYAGHLHNNTQQQQRDLLGRADLMLAVGTRLDDVTTLGRRLPDPGAAGPALVHVYPDPQRLGRVHPPTVGLAGDPVEFLRQLAAAEPAGVDAGRVAWVDELHELEVAKARWAEHPSDDGVAFGALVAGLDELTGGDVVVTLDSGTFTSWLYRYLRLTGDGRMLGVGSSAMGFGVPAGVAAALRTGRPVVVLVGDGGFLMTGSELATAVSRRLPLIVVIANNGSYGTIRAHQERAYPGRVIATDLDNPDFVALARAYGALGLAVGTEQDVEPCLARALAHGGPVVVDVRTSLSWISAYRRIDVSGSTGVGVGVA